MSSDGCRRASFNLNPMLHLVLPAGIVALLVIGLSVQQMLGLYKLSDTPPSAELTRSDATRVFAMLEQQLTTVQSIKKAYASYTVDVNMFSQRLGHIEAEVTRINALARRVIARARLDPAEFMLDKTPARGGSARAYVPDDAQLSSANGLLHAIDGMELQLVKQGNMLETLYQVIEGRAIAKEVSPSFVPVKKGYVSSPFGLRRDPFTGRGRMHGGMDFAGARGTDVHAVASGVVSFAGRKGGYGITIEVDHGDGLLSRYAHLDAALVEEGAVVKKADKIALLGSTGRSTGPHLHLEIHRHGERIDPSLYLSGSLLK